jgi:hypothetical protein
MKSLPYPFYRLLIGLFALCFCFFALHIDTITKPNMNLPYYFVLKQIHIDTDGVIKGYTYFRGLYVKGKPLPKEDMFYCAFPMANQFSDYQTPEYLITELKAKDEFKESRFQIEKIYK